MSRDSTLPNSLIIGWRLQSHHVLIIGGNQIAANRIEFILDAKPRKITLIAPKSKISDKVKEYIEKHSIIHKAGEFHVDYLKKTDDPIDLIFSAVDDEQLSNKIAIAARERNIPINVAEIPQLCDFWLMPTYRDGNLQVAISTNGTGPQIARKLRQHIIENLPNNTTDAINNVTLLKQNLGVADLSVLTKITSSLSLDELAKLTQKDIKRLTAEYASILVDKSEFDKSEVSSTTSSTVIDDLPIVFKSKIVNNYPLFSTGGAKFVDNKTAVAHIAYALSDTIFIYPTMHSNYSGEQTLHWSAQNLENVFGKVCNVIKMDTRSGASLAILGAASFAYSGKLVAFASSQSIVSMLPNLYTISKERIPLTIHVSAHGFDDNMQNIANYDALMARDTGFGIINSYSTQEMHDIALITHLISTSTKTPFLHIFDGVKAACGNSLLNLIPYAELLKLSKEISNPSNSPPSANTIIIVDKIDSIMKRIGKLVGRHYRAFEYVGSRDANILLVSCGGETPIVKEIVKHLSDNGKKVGVIIVRLYRPWSEKHFLAMVPKTVKKVAVLEQVSNDSHDMGSSLFNDVVASMIDSWTGDKPQLIDAKYPMSKQFTPSTVNTLLQQLESGIKIDFNIDPSSDNFQVQSTLNNVKRCVFWDVESKGTLSSNQHIANVFTRHSKLKGSKVSSLSTFDAFNNGGVVTTNLLFGNELTDVLHDLKTDAEYISIHDTTLISKYDILAPAKEGAIVLLNTNWTTDDLETKLPNDFRYEAFKRKIKLYIIDANKIVHDLGMNVDDHISLILQIAFLKLTINEVKINCSLEDTLLELYDGNNEKELSLIIHSAVQETDKALTFVEPPPAWQILEKSEHTLPSFVNSNSFGKSIDLQLLVKPKLGSWHTAIHNALFKEAFGFNNIQRPDVAEKTFVVTVSENRRLTPTSYDRYLFHIEFDVTGTGLKYDLGEALGVYGHNDPKEVDEFLEYYGLNSDDLISIPNKEGDKFETKTIHQVFVQILDLFGRPAKRFYESLALYATDENERKRLLWIASSEGSVEFKRRVAETITYADLLYEFTSARPPVEDLVQIIAPIKPRHYSIASAQSVHPNSVHLLVVTVEWETSVGKKRFGQCTRYLSGLKVGSQIVVSIKPSVMKLPPRDTQPVIMAGLGTGMAPFRAFIEERAYRKSKGIEVGPMILYFGSRNRSMEYLYGEELEAYHTEGLLTYLRLAFSRDQPHKVYIQHKMKDDAELLHQYLLKDEGWFYLCGPTWPVPDVKDAIVSSFVSAGELSLGDASAALNKLKDLERYILEVY
ncbi:sulfite reductase subunit alpha [Gigaspora margarita]|uniref:Sulfite reductase subunit alpha n=2 Tax=Gigaspora margarita TaxID=4874 RepID=A0A8H3XF76_GIGMA|nr:sulfite reductase subunit alpha [Gigaspora margarita]